MKRTKSSVYLETTVVSYLTSRASRDVVLAAHRWSRPAAGRDIQPPIICTPEELTED
jgi:hypothetical protein